MALASNGAYNELLSQPTTLQIFSYCLSHDDQLSVRTIQNALGIKSTSTVHWHLNKLKDGGLMEQLPNNCYIPSPKARNIRKLEVPISTPVRIVRGFFIPEFLLILSFVISTTIVVGLIYTISWQWALNHAIISLVVTAVLLYRYYDKIRQELQEFGVFKKLPSS